MWDCNNGTVDNRVPTLGQSVSYSTIFLRGDSRVLSPLLGCIHCVMSQFYVRTENRPKPSSALLGIDILDLQIIEQMTQKC